MRQWMVEDRRVELEKKHREKQMSSMTGSTLEDLSTRETEMSVHETSFMISQRQKAAQGRNQNISMKSPSA